MASDRLSSLNMLAVSSLPLSQVLKLKSALRFTTYLVAQTDWYYQHTWPDLSACNVILPISLPYLLLLTLRCVLQRFEWFEWRRVGAVAHGLGG